MPRTLPPALPGLPLVGNLLQYRRDHVEVFWRAYRTLGPIFSLRLGPQRAVVLIGPEHHRFFFTEVDRILSLPEVYRFVVPMFGPVLNAAGDGEVRRAQLALLHSAFQGGRMRRHVEVMAREVAAWIDGLPAGGVFEVNTAFEALAMNVAASAFMGREIRARMGEFLPLYRHLANGMDFVLPPNLPLPRFRRRDRARRDLAALIGPIIAERRRHPDREDDFLQTIIDGHYLRGDAGDDETVVGLALMTVFTAYITTAAQAAWTLLQLLTHPGFLADVRAEIDDVLGDGPVGTDALARLERLDWALKETQRMHPVMSHYARFNAQAYEIGGYHVPRGWLTMVCPAVAHRLPEVFTHPDTYDPERFAPDHAEDRVHPYALIGFGGGLYRCPGAAFGGNEIKVLLGLLLRRFDLEALAPDLRRDFEMGVIRPRPPGLVRYARRDVRRAAPPRRAVEGIARCPVALGAGGVDGAVTDKEE